MHSSYDSIVTSSDHVPGRITFFFRFRASARHGPCKINEIIPSAKIPCLCMLPNATAPAELKFFGGQKLVGLGGLHNPSRKNLGHLLTSKKQVGARQEQKSLQCLAIRRPFGMHGSTMREGGREEGRKEEPMWEPTRELMSRCRSRCWSRCRYEHGRGFRWRACQHRVHPLQAGNGDSHQGPIEQCRGRRDEIERSR